MTTLPIAIGYRRAVVDALIIQVILAVLALMVLDGGRIAHTLGIAVLAFWVGATLSIRRRPKSPTKVDLFLIRIGFLPLLVITFPLAEWVWSWHWVWKVHGI